MENSFFRNVKNISHVALLTVFVGLLALTAVTVFQVLLYGEGLFSYIKNNLQGYFIYICIFAVFIFNVRLSTMDAPIIMSFCSRRKDYLSAKYLINIFIIAILLLTKLCMDISNGGFNSDSMIIVGASLIVIFGIANILGVVIIRFGMIGYLIFLFICGFGGGVIAFLFTVKFNFAKTGIMLLSILALSIIFMAISMAVERRIVLNSDIRR